MTTPAVVSRTAVPATPRAGSAGEVREDAGGASHFDRQLHAARQRNTMKDSEQSSGHRDPGVHAPMPRESGKPPADDAPAADPHDASRPLPAAPPAAAAETADAADAATGEKAPADQDETGDRAASALAAAMLALLGPSVAGVLRQGAAAKAAGTALLAGKTVAVDAKAAGLLLPEAANGTVAAPVGALTAAAGMLAAAAEVQPPAAETGKDPSKATAPAVALPVPSAPAAPAPAHVLQLQSAPGSPSFGQDLGQQVAWLGGQDVKQARIRLHPEELGSLDVSVSVTHGRVDVVFSAQHPAAVAAVQQTLPQLDHMLAQHGLSLGHAEVGQHDRGDRRGHAGDAGTGAPDEVGEIHGGSLPASPGTVGLLDAFA
ncbi:MAG: flagellar hook-length control protein FliK [Rhodanobacter sp.]